MYHIKAQISERRPLFLSEVRGRRRKKDASQGQWGKVWPAPPRPAEDNLPNEKQHNKKKKKKKKKSIQPADSTKQAG